MAEITVREFGFRVPRRGDLTRTDVTLSAIRPFELDMANVMRENALAIPYRGPLLMRLVQRELALVLSLFHHSPPGQPLTRHPAYRSSSLHIRRFTTEVMALGILNAVVTDRFGPADIAHYDILPPHLRGAYPHGSRPDLRFAQEGQILAGESRGRSGRPPVYIDFTTAQLKRLNELVDWSRHPDCDPVCMAWSWMTDAAVVSDFFSRRLVATPTDPKRFGAETITPEESNAAFGQSPPQALDEDFSEAPQPPALFDEQKASYIASQKEVREAELLHSAPSTPVAGLSDGWRGEWMQVPSIDGEPTPKVLLAASDRPRRRKATPEAHRDKLRQARNMELEVSTEGHLLFAIDWRSRPELEAGENLEQLIELDSEEDG